MKRSKESKKGKRKQILAGLMAVVMGIAVVFSAVAPVFAEEIDSSLTFSDVSDTMWYADSVYDMVDLGLFKGVTDAVNGVAEFAPDNTMTRAEFVAVVVRHLFENELETVEVGTTWWYGSYSIAVKYGILAASDFDNGKMTETITREEMAMVMSKAMSVSGYSLTSLPDGFTVPDLESVSSEYTKYVENVYALGIIAGVDTEGTFDPEGVVTRASAAVILNRFVDSSKRISIKK